MTIHSRRSKFPPAVILVALLVLLVAGGRDAIADTPTAAPQPAPTNIKQSWDGTKNAMTITWDPLPQPPSGTQLTTIYYVCTDISAGSTCSNVDRPIRQLDVSGNEFTENSFVASSDPQVVGTGEAATSDPPDKATHFTMTGINSTDYYVWQLCAIYKTGAGAVTRPCSPNIVLNNGAHITEDGDCTNCPGFWTTPGPNGCMHEDLLDYYAWRWAYPGDTVCVDPSRLTQVLADNAQADARRAPNGGASGPNTCISGYVWRVAKPDDLVCVTPAERDRIAAENANPKPTQH